MQICTRESLPMHLNHRNMLKHLPQGLFLVTPMEITRVDCNADLSKGFCKLIYVQENPLKK